MKSWVRTMTAGAMLAAMLTWLCLATTVEAQTYTSPYFNSAMGNIDATRARARRFGTGREQRLTRPTREQQLAYERAVESQRERGRLVIRSGRIATTFAHVGYSIAPRKTAEFFATNEDERQQLEQMYKGCLSHYEQTVNKIRRPANDVAVTLSDLISVARQVRHDAAPLTQAQFDSLVPQMREFLLRSEMFQGRDNAEKQQAHEDIAITWSLLADRYLKARRANDQRALNMVREQAKQAVAYYIDGASIDGVEVSEGQARLSMK